jgi:hypothetical protein
MNVHNGALRIAYMHRHAIFQLCDATVVIYCRCDAGKCQIVAAMFLLTQFIFELYVTLLSLYCRYDSGKWQIVDAVFLLKQFIFELYVTPANGKLSLLCSC